MKFQVIVRYEVVKNDYRTDHTSTKVYHAADAVVCLVSHLNQLAADTNGMIINVQANVIESSFNECKHEFELQESESKYLSHYVCKHCGIPILDREPND